MSEGKYGIENMKDVVKVVFSIVKKAKELHADGAQATDVIEILKWGLTDETFKVEIKEAIKDADKIALEFMDLKFSEILDLVKFVKEELKELNVDFSKLLVILKYVPFLEKILKKIFY